MKMKKTKQLLYSYPSFFLSILKKNVPLKTKKSYGISHKMGPETNKETSFYIRHGKPCYVNMDDYAINQI